MKIWIPLLILFIALLLAPSVEHFKGGGGGRGKGHGGGGGGGSLASTAARVGGGRSLTHTAARVGGSSALGASGHHAHHGHHRVYTSVGSGGGSNGGGWGWGWPFYYWFPGYFVVVTNKCKTDCASGQCNLMGNCID